MFSRVARGCSNGSLFMFVSAGKIGLTTDDDESEHERPSSYMTNPAAAGRLWGE